MNEKKVAPSQLGANLATTADVVVEKARHLSEIQLEPCRGAENGISGMMAYSALRDATFDMEFTARRVFWEASKATPGEYTGEDQRSELAKAADDSWRAAMYPEDEGRRSDLTEASNKGWVAAMYLGSCCEELRWCRNTPDTSKWVLKMAEDRVRTAHSEFYDALVELERAARVAFWRIWENEGDENGGGAGR